ncbi:MAG: LytR C-terminal domain-containing protein [Microthrixaceae bacterium]
MTTTEPGPPDGSGNPVVPPAADPSSGVPPVAGAPAVDPEVPEDWAPVVRRNRSRSSGSSTAPSAPSARTTPSRRRLTFLQAGLAVLFVLLLVGLGVVGYRASLKITGGGSTVTDPKAPGYVAEVQPTPVDLVAVESAKDRLASALIVVGGADGKGGTVIPIPPSLVLPAYDGAAPITAGEAYTQGGISSLRERLGPAVTFGFTSASTVTAEQLGRLVQLTGPLKVQNADNLLEPVNRLDPNYRPAAGGDGTGTVKYRSGSLTLDGPQLAEYLGFTGEGETVVNQALRQQAAVTALLTGLKGKDLTGVADAASGQDASAGSVLADLVSGDVRFDQLPVREQTVPGTLFKESVPDDQQLPGFVSRTIPAPIAAFPGQRARTRLLNGTTDAAAATPLTPDIVAAGGTVVLLGNAESFDVATSRVEYTAPAAAPAAQAIAAKLGLTATKVKGADAGVDVTVVVGRDRLG